MATQPLSVIADAFEAFAIIGGPLSGKGQTRPIHVFAKAAAECVRLAMNCVPHKGYFYVRHTDGLTGAVMLSFYVVKKAKPVLRFHEHQHRMVADLYAEHLFDLDGSDL